VQVYDYGQQAQPDGGTLAYLVMEFVDGTPLSTVPRRTDRLSPRRTMAGSTPYVGDGPLEVLNQVIHGPSPTLPSDVPAEVAAVVVRAMAKDPARRYPNAAALAEAARSVLDGQRSTGRTTVAQAAFPVRHIPQPSTSFRARLTRRGLLTTLAAGAAASALDGCTATQHHRKGLLPSASTSANLIMIIRHAEKPADTDAPYGIDADGNPDKHSLTVRGWMRAGALVSLFAPGSGTSRPGLARPTAIFAAGGSGGEGRRTRETVTPLAARLGLTVSTQYARGSEPALAKACLSHRGPSLICWQHGEIPEILAAFGHVQPEPPEEWPSSRFDLVWTLTPSPDGWAFSEIPQLLLDGDSN